MAKADPSVYPYAAPPPPAYTMPQASLGPCLWALHPGGEWFAALITSIGDRSVDCVVFPRDFRHAVTRASVRHVSDPDVSVHHRNDGVWEYTEESLSIRMLLERALIGAE